MSVSPRCKTHDPHEPYVEFCLIFSPSSPSQLVESVDDAQEHADASLPESCGPHTMVTENVGPPAFHL